jgi:hypothetical protein
MKSTKQPFPSVMNERKALKGVERAMGGSEGVVSATQTLVPMSGYMYVSL